MDARILEAGRARIFRHARRLRVRSARTAEAFVNQVGVCSTFYRFPDGLACLWEAVVGRERPRWPRRSHHDEGIGLTWELKDTLPAKRRCYYGKLVKRRPVLVALDLFPAFYALVRGRQRARDFAAEYRAGRMSASAKRLMDSFFRESPQYTRGLRADTFMLEPGKTREFERAMAELLGRSVALDRLVGRYLGGAVYSTPNRMARLFGLEPAETAQAVARLARAGRVRVDVEVAGWPGTWVVRI
jgi:hypothetical protein